jgi:DNA-3-methyladenine glycosylase II
MIITTSRAEILECGLSKPKVRYILQIAQEFKDQPNLIEDLIRMNPEQVLQTLQKFKGIGIWSASIFALFYLHHPDIFAWGDVSIKKAIKRLYEEQNLDEKRTEEIIEPWRPYRSTACLVLWRWIDEGAIKFS